jgi:hypothetical protein
MMEDIARIERGVELLTDLRKLFYEMEDDERDRAWTYLRDRFGEFKEGQMPAWEVIESEAVEA